MNFARKGAQAAIDQFLSDELQQRACNWLFHAAVVLITLITICEIQNIVAFSAAVTLACAESALIALKQIANAPARLCRLAQRNLRSLIVVTIIYLASFVVGSADAAAPYPAQAPAQYVANEPLCCPCQPPKTTRFNRARCACRTWEARLEYTGTLTQPSKLRASAGRFCPVATGPDGKKLGDIPEGTKQGETDTAFSWGVI